MSKINEKASEAAARALYETWRDNEGYCAWVPGGNSNKRENLRAVVAVCQAVEERNAANTRIAELEAALREAHRLCDRLISYHAPKTDGIREALIETRARAFVALSCSTPQGGWRLVPVEPTEAMLDAGLRAVSDATVDDPMATSWDALRFYRAAIAPTPKQEG